MSAFTDEQLLTAATEYAATLMWLTTGPYGPSLATHRAHLGNTSPEEKADVVKAMRAALHTLGAIEIHTPEKDGDGLYCNICRSPEDTHWAHEWPCPAAQAHEKENKNAH